MAEADLIPVVKGLFDANTILKADVDNTPIALPVPASRILGRAAAGGIAALTPADALTLLDALARSLFNANTIVKADVDNTPIALSVPASRILGRAAAGGISALTPAQALIVLGALATSLFGNNTILKADVAGTPTALTIAASRILGRGAAGNIAALTGAQIMAILSGKAGADFSMNTKKITNVVDPAAAQDVATKNYVDNAAPSLARVRFFNDAHTRDFVSGKIGVMECNQTDYDTDSKFATGVWQQGVGDGGSNATTIIDADPTTGTGFVASMRYYKVYWDAGASYGWIETVDSATQVTIIKSVGLDFGVGDTYTITKAYYEIPTSGYWQIFGLIGWDWVAMVANKQYNGGITLNGEGRITSIEQSAAALMVQSIVFADILHCDAGDLISLTAQSYSGTNTCDVIGTANGRLTYCCLSLLEPD